MVWSCKRRAINAPSRKSELIQVMGMKKYKGRQKIILVEIVKNDMSIKEVIESMILDRIHVANRQSDKGLLVFLYLC